MMKLTTIACLAAVLLATTAALGAKLSPQVTIGQGTLVGLDSEIEQGIYSFKNVPFAQPPVGQLRFADPLAPKPWSGLYNATAFGPGCMTIYSKESFPDPWMIPKTMSEDCLYLDIYTPSISNAANLPVAVFFYGGDYDLGSAQVPLYDGSDIAKSQNMVFVAINYRINVLGGLYTGGDIITGNYNYKDQLQSLKWVKENIKAFGGDGNNVMIWGQSAGAASVTSHMVGPKSWQYFSKALALSHPVGLMFSTPDISMRLAAEILKNFSCPNDGSMEMVQCLRAVPAEKLVTIGLAKPKLIPGLLPNDVLTVMMPWGPVVDGDVIPSQPITALSSGNYNKVPFVISTVANESNEFTRDIMRGNMSNLELDLLLDLMLANSTLIKAVKDFYGPIPHWRDMHLWMDPMVTDMLFYAPWVATGRRMAAAPGNKGIWQVMFTYFAAKWDKWAYKSHTNWYCRKVESGYEKYGFLPPVCHADDLAFYFFSLKAIAQDGYPVPAGAEPTPADISLKLAMQGMIGSLAKTGSPGAAFPPMAPNGPQRFMNLTAPTPIVKQDFRAKEVKFWEEQGFIHF